MWEDTTIGKVCEVIAGQSPEGKFYNDTGEGLPFYQGKKEFGDKFIGVPKKWTSKTTKEAEANDILMSVRAPVGPINFSTQKVCIGRGLAAIRPLSKIDKDFLFYGLLNLQKEISGNEGAVFASINKKQIEDISLKLPQLPEQKRIVAILDEAFAGIDQAIENTEKNLANAKELFESYLNNIFTQKGEGWEKRKLSELGKITSSKRIYKHEYKESGIPFYRTKEIKELANSKNLTLELFIDYDRYKEIHDKFGVPAAGDILMTAIGTIGEIYVVQEDDKFYFKDGNVLWLKDFKDVEPEFLKFALRSFVKELQRMSHGAAYNALPIEKLKKHVLSVPKKTEQLNVINSLRKIQNHSRSLELSYQQKLAALKELKQSLLQKAFAGELTSDKQEAA